MNYENDIPDYAMVPAKEIDQRVIVPAAKSAVYSSVEMTLQSEKPKTTIILEEDILVPDIKPDLAEILFIDGRVSLSSRESEGPGRGEDYITISGEIALQTLYLPEGRPAGCPLIAIQSKVPFKERWHGPAFSGGTLALDCSVDKIEHMVVNERKFRVKIYLSAAAKESASRSVNVFEGLTGEELQTLKEKIQITNVALRKRDALSVSQDLEIKDDCGAEAILWQNIWAVENYKQATGEKAVINGFIYVDVLYNAAAGESGEESADCIRQFREKVEFTQFIPLGRSESWSGSDVFFDTGDLRVKITAGEEGDTVFRLEGDLITWLDIYTNIEREIIVDCYHREKDFVCDFDEEKSRLLIGTAIGETSVREIISPETEGGDIERILHTTARITGEESHCEQGKAITEGIARVEIICLSRRSKDEIPQIIPVKQDLSFRVSSTMPQVSGDEKVSHHIYIKDMWAERINSKQIEINLTVQVCAEIMKESSFKVLVNPAFEEKTVRETPVSMAVYVADRGDSLWSVAKKFKTTSSGIAALNNLEEGELCPGRKLLIMK